MLLGGLNHVAVLTGDTDRLHAFYPEVFEATVAVDDKQERLRFSIVDVGPHTELNVFQPYGDHPAPPQVPMFHRGRLDHLGLQAAITDFGPALSLFFRGPEVCMLNPDATPGTVNPPGTPASTYSS